MHHLTLADLRHYFNVEANETNNIPTVNRNLSSSEPILNDAPDIGRSDRFQTMGLQVAERGPRLGSRQRRNPGQVAPCSPHARDVGGDFKAVQTSAGQPSDQPRHLPMPGGRREQRNLLQSEVTYIDLLLTCIDAKIGKTN